MGNHQDLTRNFCNLLFPTPRLSANLGDCDTKPLPRVLKLEAAENKAVV